jgi:predicted Na+-dependent transporter
MICDLFQQVLAAVFAKLFAEKDETGGESEEEGGK